MSELAVDPAWQRRLTLEEYHRLIDKGVFDEDEHVEMLEGVLIAMSPQGPRHARIITHLAQALWAGKQPELLVRVQLPLTLRRSEPEPDIAVVRANDERDAPRHPSTALLVIEVSGADSLEKDRTLKAALYAEAGIVEYWVVNVEERCVEVLGDPDPVGRVYRARSVARPGDVLRPLALAGATVDLAFLA